MDRAYSISLTDAPTAEERETIERGLTRYNSDFAPDGNYKPLCIFIRDGNGNIVGGLLGETYWLWLHIGWVWLAAEIRREGYGTRLIEMAEAEARARGCVGINVDTMSFQALDFYKRFGYSVFGQLDDFPPGHTRYFLKKVL